jgi:parallel beta-helix repeat protein
MPTTHKVDCDDGEKIQDKIDIAQPGDTILVKGLCTENLAILSETVRITLDGQDRTRIQAPPKGDGFFIRGREITVKGFAITGGRDGIHLSGVAAGASANIVENTIRRTGRHGIHLDHSSIGRIAGNTIENVLACGIDVAEGSVARIGYLLRPLGHGPNSIRGCGGHGIAVTRGSSARIVGNRIENNKGSGILVSRQSQADVFGNAISGNEGNGITASHNGGINLDNEDKLFNLGPNTTNPASKNAGAGLSGSVGGYADGPMGTLSGAKGAKEMDGTCIDRLTGLDEAIQTKRRLTGLEEATQTKRRLPGVDEATLTKRRLTGLDEATLTKRRLAGLDEATQTKRRR